MQQETRSLKEKISRNSLVSFTCDVRMEQETMEMWRCLLIQAMSLKIL